MEIFFSIAKTCHHQNSVVLLEMPLAEFFLAPLVLQHTALLNEMS
jgi:hypothetical protein